MALVTGTSGYLSRSGGLPASSTAFTILGGGRLTTDRNALSTLLFFWSSAFGHYVGLQTASDGTTLNIFSDQSGGGTGPSLTVNTRFMWALRCSGTGTNLLQLLYREIGQTSVTTYSASHGGSSWTPAGAYFGDTSFNEAFAGEIGPIWVYNEALTDAEVAQQFSRIAPIKSTNLYGWFPANDITLTNRYIDRSEQKANLTAVNTITAADNPPISWGASPIILAATALNSYTLTAETASFTLSGQAVNLRAARDMNVDAATYALNAQNVGLVAGRKLAAGVASYSLAGQDVGLRAARLLTAGQASYALAAQDVGLRASRLLTAASASYTLNAQNIGLRATRLLTTSPASYAISGQDVTFLNGFPLTAETATYSLNGQPVSLRATRLLPLTAASYAIAAQDAGLSRNRVVLASKADYSITAQDVGLNYSGSVPSVGRMIWIRRRRR